MLKAWSVYIWIIRFFKKLKLSHNECKEDKTGVNTGHSFKFEK